MRTRINLNEQWTFTGPQGDACAVDLPHTWNAVDGQDGGNDYWRGTCTYEKDFAMPRFDPAAEDVYLEFAGVNASADVELNGHPVLHHDGGYSTFRGCVTGLLAQENHLVVKVDNGVNDRVYPQKADFTFYGGIYRDVELVVVNKHRFSMDHFGGPGLKVTPRVAGADGEVRVESWNNAPGALNKEGYKSVARQLAEKFGFEKVAITLRESKSAFDNDWSAMLYDVAAGEYCFSKLYHLHIIDRIGGGDSFGGGLIHALLEGRTSQQAVEFAVAASALKHSIEGDYNFATVAEVEKLAGGDGSGRVQR